MPGRGPYFLAIDVRHDWTHDPSLRDGVPTNEGQHVCTSGARETTTHGGGSGSRCLRLGEPPDNGSPARASEGCSGAPGRSRLSRAGGCRWSRLLVLISVF